MLQISGAFFAVVVIVVVAEVCFVERIALMDSFGAQVSTGESARFGSVRFGLVRFGSGTNRRGRHPKQTPDTRAYFGNVAPSAAHAH